MNSKRFLGETSREYVEFYDDGEHNHRWRMVAGNNEIVGASTEAFFSQHGAMTNFQLMLRIGNSIAAANHIP